MKKVSLLLILALTFVTASAQEKQKEESGVSKEAGRKTTFVQNGFWDNWYIGAGVGANMYFGKRDGDAGFFKRPTVIGSLQVGKWINPYLGLRAKGTLGKIHTFANDAQVMHRQLALTAEVDVMFDVINYFGKYNEKRIYSVIPYVGIGGAYGRGYTRPRAGNHQRHHEKSLTFNAGIINSFKVTEKLAIDVEFSGILLKDDFDRRKGGKRAYDLLGQATVGVSYKLGSTHNFTEARLYDQNEIDGLNDEVNRLRAENQDLSKRPVRCPECPKTESKVVEVVKEGMGNSAVYFRIGSTSVDRNQEANIYNVAKYLQDTPSAKVEVIGYADKETGSPKFNSRISEKRAKNVANMLIKKFKIDSNRVAVSWKGDTEQPYNAQNAWNRVVIFVEQK